MLFPHKVSLFNKSRAGTGELWLPTSLDHVLFTVDEDLTLRDVNSAASEIVKVYIPQRYVDSEGKDYIDPKSFARQDIEFQQEYFTFARGDYIGLGDISLDGDTPSSYRNKNGGIYEIASMLTYSIGGLPSWVIVAR